MYKKQHAEAGNDSEGRRLPSRRVMGDVAHLHHSPISIKGIAVGISRLHANVSINPPNKHKTEHVPNSPQQPHSK